MPGQSEHPPPQRLLAAVLLLAAAGGLIGWLARSSGSQPPEALESVRQRQAELEASQAELARLEASPDQVVEAPAPEKTPELAPARPAPTRQPAAQPQLPDAPPLPIFGVVLDEQGHLTPGVRVVLQQKPVPLTEAQERQRQSDLADSLFGEFDPKKGKRPKSSLLTEDEILEMVAGIQPRDDKHPSVVTDDIGAFRFEGSDAARAGTLVFAPGLSQGGNWKQDVQVDGSEHILAIPPPGRTAPSVLVQINDEDGQGHYPDEWHLSLDKPLPGHVVRKQPQQRWIQESMGMLTFDFLGPGSWTLRARRDSSGWGVLSFEVPVSGLNLELELVLPGAAGSGQWSEFALDADQPTEHAAPEESSGYAAWVPPNRRSLGQARSNAFFSRTLRGFGEGPVKSAQLEIHLRAVPDISHNDSINLEYVGSPDGPRFRWSMGIAKLTPSKTWNQGQELRLILDLAKLPTKEGSMSLLKDLEDGRLDVSVQDDTAVDFVNLLIAR